MIEKINTLVSFIKQYPLLAIFAFIALFVIATIIRKSLKLILTLIIVVLLIVGILYYNDDWLKEENIKSLENIKLEDLKQKSEEFQKNAKKRILKKFQEELTSDQNNE